jgi:arylsulfatase A-like enzyme
MKNNQAKKNEPRFGVSVNRVMKTALPLVLMAGYTSCGSVEKEKPNVVMIFIDDMGYADVSCFGNPIMETPNIDALAAQGLMLTNFYVNAPICSPSRVALNTGQYPMRYHIHSFIAASDQNRNRAMKDYLDPNAPFYARVLQENGYATGHFGKWHMGGGRDIGDVPHPTEYGFDQSLVSFEGIGDRVLFPNDNLSAQSAQLGRGTIIWAEKHQSTQIYIDSTLAFIDRNPDKPFFINLNPNDVHDPFIPKESSIEKFKSITDNPYEQQFLAVLEELDNQIGRLVSELKKRDRFDNTIIIFTSDNGPTDWPYYYNPNRYPEGYEGSLYPPGFAGEFYGRKWSLYEGGIRMPFIISWPAKIPAGKIDNTSVVAAIDLFPSICSMIGLEYPNNLDGIDRSKVFLGTPVDRPEPIMWEYSSNPGGSIQPGNRAYRSPNLAIREGDWKLLINIDGTGAQLYNLVNDPGEQNNLVDQHQEIASDLTQKVFSWRKSMPVALPETAGSFSYE